MSFYRRKLILITFSFIVGLITLTANKSSSDVQIINFDDPMVISPGTQSFNFENFHIDIKK